MGKQQDIAIIGMACRFPGARDYQEYWKNLESGVNSVGEIPLERWDWREYLGDPQKDVNKTNSKWGGFIEEVDAFDPLFFNISPKEANFIDPQHRLFLETTWHAIEDAGYRASDLSGKNIGVYAGVSKNDYAELINEKEPISAFVSTGTVHSILSNRVSFLLNFHGKSESVDTACSSALVAIHNAIRDIACGDCEAALVGGVNALLSPRTYISHAKSGMLSADGQCKTFDASANGYVRGEGVGVLFIKPLAKASEDRDRILAVIKSSAINHGGRSNFLTAPNVDAQASVVYHALKKAAIDPRTITYIETHGTGTPLGDPIEINALKKAYAAVAKEQGKPLLQYTCGLGAVKTNIGHLESAAGIASIIKVIMAFRYRTLPPLLHFQTLNPHLELDQSPFRIIQSTSDWEKLELEGELVPRRSGVSSFGMGGVNAHMILEEAPRFENRRPKKNSLKTKLFLFSTKKGRLQSYVKTFAQFLHEQQENISIEDVEYTLCFGREEWDERLAVVADNLKQLLAHLEDYLQGAENENLYTGSDKTKKLPRLESTVDFSNKRELAQLWAKGHSIPWCEKDFSGVRMGLPVYPFARKRCWFTDKKINVSGSQQTVDQPRSVENEKLDDFELQLLDSKADTVSYQIRLPVTSSILQDHRVQQTATFPGAGYLELVRRAGILLGYSKTQLHNVFWLSPYSIQTQLGQAIFSLEIQAKGTVSIRSEQGEHFRAELSEASVQKSISIQEKLDISSIKQRCCKKETRASLYPLFEQHGLRYGDSFQTIDALYWNETEVLAKVQSRKSNHVGIYPGNLDGAFQAVVALSLYNKSSEQGQFVPYFIQEYSSSNSLPENFYAHARQLERSTKLLAFDVNICDEQGHMLTTFKAFKKRAFVQQATKNQTIRNNDKKIYFYTSHWVANSTIPLSEADPVAGVILVNGDSLLKKGLKQQLHNKARILSVNDSYLEQKFDLAAFNSKPCEASYAALFRQIKEDNIALSHIVFCANLTTDENAKSEYKALLQLSQAIMNAKLKRPLPIIYLYDPTTQHCAYAHAVAGFARTLKYENPRFRLDVVGLRIEAEENFKQLRHCLELQHLPLNEAKYENNQILAREIKVLHPAAVKQSNDSLVKVGGSYLVVGGAGGLGQLFSLYLAREYGAKIALLGRRSKNQKIQKLVEQISSAGGHAEYYSVDISDREALTPVIQAVRKKFGLLNGIIQASGVIEDAYILRKKADSFCRVIEPKLSGTLNLDIVTAKDSLDFFLVFSSIAALMPNQGQCDYATANSFLDHFAEYRSRQVAMAKRQGLTLAINWPLWANGGMQVNTSEQEHLWSVFGMKPLATEQGFIIFEKALQIAQAEGLHQIIAIEGDREKINQRFNISTQLHQPITTELTDARLCELVGRDLRTVFARGLRTSLDTLTEDIAFRDLGIDSLGIQMVSHLIEKYFQTDFKPTLLFEYDSLAKIKHYLLEKKRDHLEKGYRQQRAEVLLNRCLGLIDIEKTEDLLFQRTFTNQEFYMLDHVVDGAYNVPGACYVEMARQAGAHARPDKRIVSLSNNYWAKQLSSTGPAFTAYIQLTPTENNSSHYEIYSLNAEDKITHATGKLLYDDGVEAGQEQQLDLEKIQSRCSQSWSREEVYKHIHAEGLIVGPTFMPMQSIVLNEGEALSYLEIPQSVDETWSDYYLHPSLLTGAFQTALISNRNDNVDDDKVFIPIAISQLELKNIIPQQCYVYTQIDSKTRSHSELRKFAIYICDNVGNVLAKISDFVIRAQKIPHVDQAIAKTSAGRDRATTEKRTKSSEQSLVVDYLKQKIAPIVGLEPHELDANTEFEFYGINSVMILELNEMLELEFGDTLSKTLFFEYQSLGELSQYFLEEHAAQLANKLKFKTSVSVTEQEEITNATAVANVTHIPQVEPPSVHPKQSIGLTPAAAINDIAIIRLAGRYPKANTLDEFWDLLKEGADCIEEIPRERFDYRHYYNSENSRDKSQGKLYSKWGSFISDIDKFDPLFFNIAPIEAESIDPQERLFLEVAWQAVEDAGYTRKSLKKYDSVGVFVGALWQPYNDVAAQANRNGQTLGPSSLLYSIANRVSYVFDFSGPSLAIDTACSSSLTALHFACQSLNSGDSKMALVGGVNLSIGASKYLFLSQYKFLSTDGRCRSFGEGGDGYVPGEGIGAVLLKPLSDAIADRDHIYGVIKGTAVNHGGKTSGYTVPNPKAQTKVIVNALRKAQVDPRTISYVEAHGTGTALGDPIEITGLTKAYNQANQANQYCAIGSVKSNIGHLEASAGIAGLTKILLQFKHRQLVPSIHSQCLNSNIDFAKTPFYVQRQLSAWDSQVVRRSALSSFGAGGANAHIVLEEHIDADDDDPVILSGDLVLIPLSAKSEERLKVYARQMSDFVRTRLLADKDNEPEKKTQTDNTILANLAYTLQTGREAMEHRIVLLVKDLEDFASKLDRFIDEQKTNSQPYLFSTQAGHSEFTEMARNEDFQLTIETWIEKNKLEILAKLWVNGIDFSWEKLYQNYRPKRISLPTYPFLKESYWLPGGAMDLVEDSTASDQRTKLAGTMNSVKATSVSSEPENLYDADLRNYHLHYYIDTWKKATIGREYSNTSDSNAVLFISTLNSQAIIEELKNHYPNSKVIHIKKETSFYDSALLLLYEQLFFTVKQLLQGNREIDTIIILCHEHQAPLYAGFSGFVKSLAIEKIIKRAKQLTLPKAATLDRLMETIHQETCLWSEALSEIQYRDSTWRRYIKTYQNKELLTKSSLSHAILRENGVYWIAGGLGGLGQLFVEYLTKELPSVNIILSGRSQLDEDREKKIAILYKKGVKVIYLQGDLADQKEVQHIYKSIIQKYGRIDGIIHAAGLNKDSLFFNKKLDEVQSVFGPKIRGTVNLDLVTKDASLDFFCLFSSIASQFGNAGQSDYALANGFMDGFAHYRHKLHVQGKRPGQTLSVNWPLWAEGGMSVEQTVKDAMFEKWGTVPLPTASGQECLEQGLASAYSQIFPLYGDTDRIEKNIQYQNNPGSINSDSNKPVADNTILTSIEGVREKIKSTVSGILKISPELINNNNDIKEYGFDSISLSRLAKELSEHFQLEIETGQFFEHDSIDKIASYVINEMSDQDDMQQANNPRDIDEEKLSAEQTSILAKPIANPIVAARAITQEEIAIIGLDGRFPGAEHITQLWENVINKHIHITNINKDPFRFKDASLGKFKHLRGGLLPNIDVFDADFFCINDEEAALMDPQQRLLLESVWRVVENAGYRMDQLSKGQTGVFIGGGSNDYLQLMCRYAQPSNSHTQVGLSQSMLANRISYQFNLRGPSEICDTACSSSIVAIHRALKSLQEGECNIAIVGGVQVLLSSRGFHGIHDLGFLSSTGHTYPFDTRSDGFVRGEGVGSVLLKPLVKAERDRDYIYAVIKGSAVHHGGNSNLSLVSPSTNGQAEAITQAVRRSGVEPSSIGYIETHGTGTQFGDPAEISAIKKAFENMLNGHPRNAWRCGLGSLKPNIGHLEPASGMAALSKVVMALNNKKKPPLAEYKALNPSLTLKNSPFYIVEELEDWETNENLIDPRRASLNSYGFGGVNAHLVLEEYTRAPTAISESYEVITLSAYTMDHLAEKALLLRQSLTEQQETLSLLDVSWTLNAGRMPLPARLAIVARDVKNMIELLSVYQSHPNCFCKQLDVDSSQLQEVDKKYSRNGTATLEDARTIAQQWVSGVSVDWQTWFKHRTPRRVILPGHLFKGRSYWYYKNEPSLERGKELVV